MFALSANCSSDSLNVIPSIIQYGDSVKTEQERDKEEIRKVIVQKIPHLRYSRSFVPYAPKYNRNIDGICQ